MGLYTCFLYMKFECCRHWILETCQWRIWFSSMSTLEYTQWTVDTIRTLYKVSITCRVSPSRRHPGVTTLQHDTADCTPLTPRMSDGRARWCRDRGRNSSELRSCDGLTPRLANANANQQLSSVQFTVGLGFSFTCLFLFILFAKFDAAILSCLPAFVLHTPYTRPSEHLSGHRHSTNALICSTP